MPRSTDKRWKVLSPGALKAKTVTMADTHVVDTYSQITAEFMSRIFDLGSGHYLITDEADILGFASFDESDTTESRRRIVRGSSSLSRGWRPTRGRTAPTNWLVTPIATEYDKATFASSTSLTMKRAPSQYLKSVIGRTSIDEPSKRSIAILDFTRILSIHIFCISLLGYTSCARGSMAAVGSSNTI